MAKKKYKSILFGDVYTSRGKFELRPDTSQKDLKAYLLAGCPHIIIEIEEQEEIKEDE